MRTLPPGENSIDMIYPYENQFVEVKGLSNKRGEMCFNSEGSKCGCDYFDVDSISIFN